MPRPNASEKILKAAKLCLIDGQGTFEMADVAKAADVSEGLAYHYFKSKAGLTSAIIQDFFERYIAVVNRRFDGSIPWGEREFQRLQNVVDFLYEDPLASIVMGKVDSLPQASAVWELAQVELNELSARNIQNGIERGHIPNAIDPGIAGAAIMGAIRQAFTYAMSQSERPDPDALATQLWQLIAGSVGLETTIRTVAARS